MRGRTRFRTKCLIPEGYKAGFDGASGGDRTLDLLITNQPLYRLSYAGPMDASEKTGKEL